MTTATKPKSRINARLDAEIARKLQELMRLQGKSVTEIIKASIEHYHTATCRNSATPRAALSKFIGCAEGASDLSTNYKRFLTKSLTRKHGRG